MVNDPLNNAVLEPSATAKDSRLDSPNGEAPASPAAASCPSAGPGPRPNPSIFYTLRHHPGDLVRYLYFMRFSLLLWLSMIVLGLADQVPAVASISRGILTPYSPWQWVFTGFAVILPGWFALLAARIVCAYGADRFGAAPPPIFYVPDRMQWFVFWGAQIPGFALLLRIARDVVHENEPHHGWVFACLFAGGLVALLFWYLIAILYYWVWDPDSSIPARAFLVPAWTRLPLEEIENLPRTFSLRLISFGLGELRRMGPGYELQGYVAPGHVVATIALLCAIVLYFLMMPISAPVPVPHLAGVRPRHSPALCALCAPRLPAAFLAWTFKPQSIASLHAGSLSWHRPYSSCCCSRLRLSHMRRELFRSLPTSSFCSSSPSGPCPASPSLPITTASP